MLVGHCINIMTALQSQRSNPVRREESWTSFDFRNPFRLSNTLVRSSKWSAWHSSGLNSVSYRSTASASHEWKMMEKKRTVKHWSDSYHHLPAIRLKSLQRYCGDTTKHHWPSSREVTPEVAAMYTCILNVTCSMMGTYNSDITRAFLCIWDIWSTSTIMTLCVEKKTMQFNAPSARSYWFTEGFVQISFIYTLCS